MTDEKPNFHSRAHRRAVRRDTMQNIADRLAAAEKVAGILLPTVEHTALLATYALFDLSDNLDDRDDET